MFHLKQTETCKPFKKIQNIDIRFTVHVWNCAVRSLFCQSSGGISRNGRGQYGVCIVSSKTRTVTAILVFNR